MYVKFCVHSGNPREYNLTVARAIGLQLIGGRPLQAFSRISVAVAIFISVAASGPVASQESCGNLQHQLQVLRGSGGAGSNWESFAIQRMQELGCFGGQQSSGCPDGYEVCGNMCCGPSNYCSRYGCIARESIECGGYYCHPGQQCSRSGGCQPAGSVDCGAYYCQPDQKCGKGWRACLAQDAVDCGPRRATSCPAGSICWIAPADYGSVKKGKLYCPTAREATGTENAIREVADQKRRAERERREAAEQERKRKIEDARETAKRKEEERKADLERKKQEQLEAKRKEVEAKRQAADIARDKSLLAAMNNPKEFWASRCIAAIALGRDTSRVAGLNCSPSAGAQPHQRALTPAQRELTGLALGKIRGETAGARILSSAQLRAVADDPKELPVAREIAMIALGTPTTPAASKADRSSAQPAAVQPSMPLVITRSNDNPLIRIYSTPAASALLNSLAAAGSVLAKREIPTVAASLGYAKDAAVLLHAASRWRENKIDATLEVAQAAADKTAVWAAGKLVGPVGAFAMQGAIEVQKQTIAPYIADRLLEKWPDTFIPPPVYNPIYVNPFTGKPEVRAR